MRLWRVCLRVSVCMVAYLSVGMLLGADNVQIRFNLGVFARTGPSLRFVHACGHVLITPL